MPTLLSIEDDTVLLAGMIADDKLAFTEIYDRYWDQMYEQAIKITRNAKDAEDIVQEVFCSLWKRRHELTIHHSVSAYLCTSARYIAIRYIESNLTRHKYYQRLSEILQQHAAPPAETQVECKELEAQLSAMIAQMPHKMQEVYLLSRREHLSHKEIASKLNIAESTVKKQIGYALKIIRQAIATFLMIYIGML